MDRPRIVIPEIGQKLNNYTQAVYAAGMEPVVVSLHHIQMREETPLQNEYIDHSEVRAEQYDGLLIPGGEDINPEFYGEENTMSHPGEREMDELQFAMLERFVDAKKPVMGICRGLQLINVFFGGTLIQNLPYACRHMAPLDKPDLMHLCRAREGSWMEELYGKKFPHNSSHHQAVKALGNDLQVDSWSLLGDDVIESLHHTRLPIYAVQWHPERMCLSYERSDTVNGLPVLDFFCRICGGDPEQYRRHIGNELMKEAEGI